MILNLNGKFVEPAEALLPINDGAVLFGETLFETMKVKGKAIQNLDAHLSRIGEAARLTGFPFFKERVRDALDETAAQLSAPISRLRLTLSRGPFAGLSFPPVEKGHFIISTADYQEPNNETRRQGVNCVIAPNRRVNPTSHLPQLKRGNYADCLYAANYAAAKGAREAIFITEDSHLLEGATTNIFLVKEGRLLTPPTGKLVLGGIMRKAIISAASRLEIETEQRNISLKELYDAEEFFVTNSLIEILPVSQVEEVKIPLGPMADKLLKAVSY